MTTPTAIIGQIQPTQVPPGAVPQVAGSPSQMQQIAQSVTAAQGIPLPASVPTIKQEGLAENNVSLESGVQNSGDNMKDNNVLDGEYEFKKCFHSVITAS